MITLDATGLSPAEAMDTLNSLIRPLHPYSYQPREDGGRGQQEEPSSTSDWSRAGDSTPPLSPARSHLPADQRRLESYQRSPTLSPISPGPSHAVTIRTSTARAYPATNHPGHCTVHHEMEQLGRRQPLPGEEDITMTSR